MATPAGNAVPLSGNAFVDGLLQGSEWQFSDSNHVLTYSLSLNDTGTGGPWTDPFAMAFRQALTAWSDVANISFVETGSGIVFTESTADIAVTLTGNELSGSLEASAMGVFPDPSFADQLFAGAYERSAYPHPEGDVFFDNYLPVYTHLEAGGPGYAVMLHEIGHALGLKHTQDDGANGRPTFTDLGLSSQDHIQWSVMSSFGQNLNQANGHPETPMLLDILAIQHLYGANMSFRTGDDTYLLAGQKAIWDAGGIDTIDASHGESAQIHLTPGEFVRSGPNVMGIAYGVTIENAIGSSQSDSLHGNDVANVLDGKGSRDDLFGHAGDDMLRGGTGADLLEGGEDGDTLSGGSDNDTLDGGSGNDTLAGDAGNDSLTGGSGVDRLSGGAGNDIYYNVDADDLLSEAVDGGIDLVRSAENHTLAANFEHLTLGGNVNGTGNMLDNVITGSTLDNRLAGLDGNDTLNGGQGNDALAGGSGNDTLDGGWGNDTLNGGLGIDQVTGWHGDDLYILDHNTEVPIEYTFGGADTVQSRVTYTLSANVENLVLTENATKGTGNTLANTLTGNTRANTLSGDAGEDSLDGGSGNDILNGGSGHDTLNGGLGIDQMSGGAGNDVYVANNSSDTTTENANEGRDLVLAGGTRYALRANVENLTLTGSAGDGTGNNLNNVITGNSVANQLVGGAGNDTMNGGLGNDTLAGGSGNDRFIFDTVLNESTNVDVISDFDPVTDALRLDDVVFTGLVLGTISSSAFRSGTQAQDADDRIIYNATTGAVLFDSDGTGAAAAVRFATLDAGLTITNSDFIAV